MKKFSTLVALETLDKPQRCTKSPASFPLASTKLANDSNGQDEPGPEVQLGTGTGASFTFPSGQSDVSADKKEMTDFYTDKLTRWQRAW